MQMKVINKFKLMIMLLSLLFMGVVSINTASAEPSSNVAWTKENRDLIANGDPEKGKKLAKKCAKCHGVDGTDPDVLEEEDTPYLAGQVPHANYKQLVDYMDKKRDDRDMQKRIRGLTKEDFADLSAFYATQDLPMPSVAPEDVPPEAVQLAIKGDGSRFIPPCAGCHGPNGEGAIVDVPALAGQSPTYFVTTMTAYRDDDRENDIYRRMRFISKILTEEEIEGLAKYYASIGTGDELLVVESDEDGGPEKPDAPEEPDPPEEPSS